MADSKELDTSKIKFPCAGYHVAVIADKHDEFVTILEEIINKNCSDYDALNLRVISSKNGTYQSFRFTVTAESEEQLKRLHDDLKGTGRVHMVL